ncbi:TRAP transporter large permease [Halalkalibacter oceani]|uniref:TRAP transporter large permease n=1 Tax=Halalkalibacter oceani TaxID=1653776 RepID=UPI003394C1B0
MEWYFVILMFFLMLMALIFFGFPIAFAFLTINTLVAIIFIGFSSGINTLVNSSFEALAKFTLTPVPLFILMGEILFHSGLVMKLLDAFSKFLGKIPARLSLLSIGTGTLLSAMSGSAVADAAMLGSTLAPEMQKRGYHLRMIVGPIVAAGTLALIIPPSTVAILLASTARINVGHVLIAGILPGILIAIVLAVYYMVMGYVKPELAPIYEVEKPKWSERFKALFMYVLPIASLIFFVLGLIFSGVVTPTESASTGVLGALILAIVYRKLSLKVLKNALVGTVKVSGMIMLIIAASAGFSQILSYTGATRGLVEFVVGTDVAPIITVIIMLLIVLMMGTFIEPISIMMITIPLYYPVITALEYDPIWFAIMMLICLGLGNITPPFGLLLFVMKGALPSNVPVKRIYTAVIPVVLLEMAVVALILFIPEITTWLPYLSD